MVHVLIEVALVGQVRRHRREVAAGGRAIDRFYAFIELVDGETSLGTVVAEELGHSVAIPIAYSEVWSVHGCH